MKKEFEHRPKSSPRRKGERTTRKTWFYRGSPPLLSFSMNVTLSHWDLIKDFYLITPTHSVPSALLIYHFYFNRILTIGWWVRVARGGNGCHSDLNASLFNPSTSVLVWGPCRLHRSFNIDPSLSRSYVSWLGFVSVQMILSQGLFLNSPLLPSISNPWF